MKAISHLLIMSNYIINYVINIKDLGHCHEQTTEKLLEMLASNFLPSAIEKVPTKLCAAFWELNKFYISILYTKTSNAKYFYPMNMSQTHMNYSTSILDKGTKIMHFINVISIYPSQAFLIGVITFRQFPLAECPHMQTEHTLNLTCWVYFRKITIYCQVYNIRHTKSQLLKYFRTALRLSLPNPLEPDVKSRMKM